MTDDALPHRHDDAHRYVAGTLSPEEARDFELHMFGCAECQRAVREAVALRAVLREMPAELPPAVRRSSVGRVVALALPLAAAVVLLVLNRDDPLRELGRLDTPPAFRPLLVRSSVSEFERQVDSAMALYGAGQFAPAREALAGLAARQPTPAVMFFLGASALASGDARSAIEPLRSAVADPGGSYANDARVLLAKAHLRLGNADSAVVALSGSDHPRVKAFLDSMITARDR